MQELWVICGRTPVTWQIPFYVTWVDGAARLDEAMPLYQSHKAAVNQLLSLHGEMRGRQWYLSPGSLSHIGEKTTGGNVETYFAWGTIRPVDRRPQDEREERDEFLEALYAAGVGESVTQLKYFWREFCLHAAHWMINKEKPVDMIFARLHNCPYRANWRTILTQRFRKLGTTLHCRSGVAREYAIDQSGLREEMLSLDLLAINRLTETCYRHIEIEHRPKWWKLVRRAEKDRKTLLGKTRYADYFLDSVRRFIRPGLTLYTSWLAQIASPCVADCESGPDGGIRFVPNHLAGKLHPASREYCGLAPVVPNKFPRFKPASIPENLLGADGELPAVPVVQSPAEDVRERPDERPATAVDQP